MISCVMQQVVHFCVIISKFNFPQASFQPWINTILNYNTAGCGENDWNLSHSMLKLSHDCILSTSCEQE